MPRIDTHAHIVVPEITTNQGSEPWRPEVIQTPDGQFIQNNRFRNGPTPREILDVAKIIEDMDEMRIDIMALSVPPFLFLYDLPDAEGLGAAQVQNDALARLNQQYPSRFANLATVPLQNLDLAVQELERAITELGLNGVEIGSNVMGVPVGDPRFRPFWEAAADMDLFVFIHPDYFQTRSTDVLKDYYLVNLVGNPVETGINAAHMVFSGLLEAFPNLKVMLGHAGGVAPWIVGRWEHGYGKREEPRRVLNSSPIESFKRFYFDTVAHHPAALKYLVEVFGSDHVLLGSDFPFDMGPDEPVAEVEALPIAQDDINSILGGNAAQLLGRA